MRWRESTFSSRKDLFYCDLWLIVGQYSTVIVLLQFLTTLNSSVMFEIGDGFPTGPWQRDFLHQTSFYGEGQIPFPYHRHRVQWLLVTFGSQDSKFL